MRIKIIIICLVSLFLFACENRIDTSSPEATKSSIEKVKNSLDAESKKDFEEAMDLIYQDDSKTRKNPFDFSAIGKRIHAKTATEIIAEGKKIKAIIEAEKKEQAKIEIAELYLKKSEYDSNVLNFSKFVVTRSRLYKQKTNSFLGDATIIELSVTNGLDKAVSNAYFNGTLSSPNRTVPWHEEGFNYKIPGGLEPNEKTTWKLEVNMFSDWAKIEIPKDAIFTVKATQLDDAAGNKLYPTDIFGESEKARLDELIKNYPEFRQ